MEKTDYYKERTNEEYRKLLSELFESIDDNKELQFFYTFCTEKHNSK